MNSFNSRKFFPQEIKIATDGLALITNRENPDTLITVNEIRSILTGKVTQWKEIYPASRLKDIRLVFDNKNSSTVRFAVDSICKGAPLSDQVKALKTNREVIDFGTQHLCPVKRSAERASVGICLLPCFRPGTADYFKVGISTRYPTGTGGEYKR